VDGWLAVRGQTSRVSGSGMRCRGPSRGRHEPNSRHFVTASYRRVRLVLVKSGRASLALNPPHRKGGRHDGDTPQPSSVHTSRQLFANAAIAASRVGS
jgi:hypothetical protein